MEKSYDYPKSKRFVDLTGMTFGLLRVLEFAYMKIYPSTALTFWRCLCKCNKEIMVSNSSLRVGRSTSCGCLTKKHGMVGQKMYKTWDSMKQRCYNPNFIRFKDWGGRGITICDEWRYDFKAFHDWAVANGWEKGLEIERVDNDGNYEPSNCTWIVPGDQSRNRRSTKLNWGRVFVIRQLDKNKFWNRNKLACIYGIHVKTISGITTNKKWIK